MSALNKNLRYTLMIAPLLLLTACGEGYEMVSYDGFPYGNARTAGTGVAYVRANMMPARGPAIRAEMPEAEKVLEQEMVQPEPAPAPEPVAEPASESDSLIEQAEEIFRRMQRK